MRQIQQSELYEQLVIAIEAQDLKEVIKLIQDKKVDVNSVDEEGCTLLHKAATKRCPEIVEALIAKGADINKADRYGRTPLYQAADYGHTEIVKTLIKRGADVDKADKFSGSTPLHQAIDFGHIKTIRVLVERGANIDIKNMLNTSSLDNALESSSPKALIAMVEGGMDVNKVDQNGRTLLHHAANSGHKEVVEALISKGADVNKVDQNGRTLLHYAIDNGHREVYQTILIHIAKLEAIDSCISKENLQFINASEERNNNYLQHLRNCKKEVQVIKERNESLYNLLRENDVKKMLDIWEKNENVHNEFDNEESFEKLYPKYAHTLINQANAVKKEIFLHNHKPLIDVLSKNYECNFKRMTFYDINKFFERYGNDIIVELAGIEKPLIKFVDLKNLEKREVPTLELYTFVQSIKNKGIDSNLEYSNTEQLQELHRTFN